MPAATEMDAPKGETDQKVLPARLAELAEVKGGERIFAGSASLRGSMSLGAAWELAPSWFRRLGERFISARPRSR